MTNGEYYKTAQERGVAYYDYCSERLREGGIVEGKFEWLEMKFKEELRLLPCPFCGGTPVMADNIEIMRSLSYFVRCACGARFASALSMSAAAEMWNRRAK